MGIHGNEPGIVLQRHIEPARIVELWHKADLGKTRRGAEQTRPALVCHTCFERPQALRHPIRDPARYAGAICSKAHAKVADDRCVLQRMNVARNGIRKGADLKAGLNGLHARHRTVGDVRGKGLLLALELVANPDSKRSIPVDWNAPAKMQMSARDLGRALYNRRTSNGAYGDWLMITPPLIVTAAQVTEIVEGLDQALTRLETALDADGL